MKSLRRTTSKLPQLLLLALFLALAPAALAANTWYVDGVNGNDNNNCESPQTACKTIGHAISLASSGDSMMVAAATYTENLTVGISLSISGSGAATTIIDGGGVNTVVSIASGVTVTLSRLTVRNGSAQDGGGIFNFGTLTINDSTVSGNSVTFGGGTLTTDDSALSGNGPAKGDPGGGILIEYTGTATINNSTVTANSADDGGGISNGGNLTINNSTVTGNSAGDGGGIQNGGFSLTLQDSIIANNSGGNCYGTMTSEGYNLSSDDTCNFNGPGDMNNTEPKLGNLGNHGGPTQTIPEMLTSPTVDAGNPNGCTNSHGHLLTTDQRGYPRPGKYKKDKRCDMGAYERQTD